MMATDFSEISLAPGPLPTLPAHWSATAGAAIDFHGVVRGSEDGNAITGIEYEANAEMARHQLDQLASEARGRFSLELVIIHHRIGFVPVAEASLFVRVLAERRRAAFDGCSWIIEELKARVPIWKHPILAAGAGRGA